jgi:4-hydroxythreonine-4-phosphate dehydrogenase
VKKVAITMGDPLGIGPEVIIKALQILPPNQKNHFTLIGSSAIFKKIPGWKTVLSRHKMAVVEAESAIHALEMAVHLIKKNQVHALITAPISKERIHAAGFKFMGHTEFLCHEFKVKKFAMLLFHQDLRVALSTIHLPLKDVAQNLTQKNIFDKLDLMAISLQKNFKIKKPRIAVCGLNPHAGENGRMGNEEIKVIIPAIKKFVASPRGKTCIVSGPHPADTIFHKALLGHHDAVLCQYHDQGLIPLKTTDFDHGVNMTLGLPFVRTSPDHGTAFDIAGKNQACAQSMLAAIQAALKFV